MASLSTLALPYVAACGRVIHVPPASPSLASVETLYIARVDSAKTRFTNADVRFVSGMIGHHAQALEMAGFAPTHGASPSLLTLAQRIINGQTDEISAMRYWLRDRGQSVPEVHRTDGMVMAYGAEPESRMPGMLTREEMQQLDRARGTEFDRLFLTFMIQHHSGAVEMVRNLLATDGAAQDNAVLQIASDIQSDQSIEIARMKRMLASLEGGEVR